MSTIEQHTPPNLDERYGRTRSTKRLTRAIFIVVAILFAIALIAWVVWGGLLSPASQINEEDTGHVILNDSTVEVRFQLTVEPGTATSCAVEALDAGFDVVGWKIIDIPASSDRIRALQETVHTSELANTGLIYRCWLA